MSRELDRLIELAGVKPTTLFTKKKRRCEKMKDIMMLVLYFTYVLFLTTICSPIIFLAFMGRENNFFQRTCDNIFRHVLP